VSSSLRRPLFYFLAAAALILACGPHAGHTDAAPPADPDALAVNDGSVAASTAVRVGNGVRFTLRVTNLHDRALELRFPTAETHEFIVRDSAGRELWRSTQGKLYTQTLQNHLLGSHATLSYDDRWDGGGLSGRFTAVARLRSANHPIEEQVEFVLP
jgi:hypothetical protein